MQGRDTNMVLRVRIPFDEGNAQTLCIVPLQEK